MNWLPWGMSQTKWGKVRPHFRTNSTRPMRSKLKGPSPWRGRTCNELPAIEPAGFGNSLRLVQHQQPTKEERQCEPTENPSIPALYLVQDWKLIGILTGATQDCGPQPRVVCNSSKTKRTGGGVSAWWCRSWTTYENTSKCAQNMIF